MDICDLGNIFFAKIFFDKRLNNVYSNLLSLNLCSDAFGNRGLRMLMLNYLPCLDTLAFTNTNITSDCIKILSKKYLPHFTYIGFTKQKHFRYDQLLKESKTIIGYELYKTMQINGDFHSRYKNFMYINNLTKIK